jgi:hypothetical protein
MGEAKSKNLLRIVAIFGGLVALAWALRERLITIDSPREESPSPFRGSNGSNS